MAQYVFSILETLPSGETKLHKAGVIWKEKNRWHWTNAWEGRIGKTPKDIREFAKNEKGITTDPSHNEHFIFPRHMILADVFTMANMSILGLENDNEVQYIMIKG